MSSFFLPCCLRIDFWFPSGSCVKSVNIVFGLLPVLFWYRLFLVEWFLSLHLGSFYLPSQPHTLTMWCCCFILYIECLQKRIIIFLLICSVFMNSCFAILIICSDMIKTNKKKINDHTVRVCFHTWVKRTIAAGLPKTACRAALCQLLIMMKFAYLSYTFSLYFFLHYYRLYSFACELYSDLLTSFFSILLRFF